MDINDFIAAQARTETYEEPNDPLDDYSHFLEDPSSLVAPQNLMVIGEDTTQASYSWARQGLQEIVDRATDVNRPYRLQPWHLIPYVGGWLLHPTECVVRGAYKLYKSGEFFSDSDKKDLRGSFATLKVLNLGIYPAVATASAATWYLVQ